MAVPPTATVPADRPDPQQDRPATGTDLPTSTGCLLSLVRALIDYGRQLATTLQQRTAATNLTDITLNFGTIDIADILARITRGLLRAAALEARLERRPPPRHAAPAAMSAASHPQPRAAPQMHPSAVAAEPRIVRLPTSAESRTRCAAARSAPSSPISVATSASRRTTRCGGNSPWPSSPTAATLPH
jgi:hypothetical protein